MATITFTAASVLPLTTSTTVVFSSNSTVAGESLTAGDFVYKKASDLRYWKADNTTSEKSTVAGIVANSALAGQRFNLITKDTALPVGSVLGYGNFYGLSATAGKMCDIADIGTTPNIYKKYIGQGATASTLTFDFTTPLSGRIDVA